MKKVVFTFLVATTAMADWNAGFNFRSTAGYATDPAGMTSVTGTMYPTTRVINGQSVTFGWEGTPPPYKADYRSDVGSRLAGVNCAFNTGNPLVFRVDLPAAGQYDIELGLGDMNYGQRHHLVIQSGSVPLLAIDGPTPPTQYLDAQSRLLTYQSWTSSEAAARKSFSGTVFRVSIGGIVDSNTTCIAHVRVVQIPPLRQPLRRTFTFQ